jgi:hypothetical protein
MCYNKAKLWTISSIFVGIYIWIVYRNIINIPYCDDFHQCIGFLSDFIECSSLRQKIEVLFSPIQGYHFLFTRLSILTCYALTGEINIAAMIIISNFFIMGIGITFCLWLKQKEYFSLFALLCILLLLHGQNFESMGWLIVGFVYVGTLLLAMLSISMITSYNKYIFFTGIVLTVITIFSYGNGMALFPTLTLTLFLQKRKKEMLIFSIIAGIATMCYLLHIKEFSDTPHVNFYDLLHNIRIIILKFFYFMGCSLWIPSLKIISFLCGFVIFSTYVWGIISMYYKKNLAAFSFFSFMILTAMMLALSPRHLDDMGALRYRIFGSMLTISTIMFYVENKNLLRLHLSFKIITPIFVVFSMFSTLLYNSKVTKMIEWKKISTYNWQHDYVGLAGFSHRDAQMHLQKAEKAGIFIMPKIPLSGLTSSVDTSSENWENRKSNIIYNIDFVKEQDNYFLIKGWAYAKETSMNFMDISLYLLDGTREIRIHPYFERRYDIFGDSSIPLDKVECGFFAIIPQNNIPMGVYSLGIEMKKQYIVSIKSSIKSIETDVKLLIN